jgi:integrase
LKERRTKRSWPRSQQENAGGLGTSEALAVKVSDIHDVPRFRVSITKGVSSDADGRAMVSIPKTAAGVRNITLPDWLRPILSDHIAARELGPNDWLFPSPKGGMTYAQNFRRRFWKPAVAEAGDPDLTHDRLDTRLNRVNRLRHAVCQPPLPGCPIRLSPTGN